MIAKEVRTRYLHLRRFMSQTAARGLVGLGRTTAWRFDRAAGLEAAGLKAAGPTGTVRAPGAAPPPASARIPGAPPLPSAQRTLSERNALEAVLPAEIVDAIVENDLEPEPAENRVSSSPPERAEPTGPDPELSSPLHVVDLDRKDRPASSSDREAPSFGYGADPLPSSHPAGLRRSFVAGKTRRIGPSRDLGPDEDLAGYTNRRLA